MIVCIDGIAVCVGRGNEGEVVDGHFCQGVQLLDGLIDALEVWRSLLNLAIDILLVGEFVLCAGGSREQTIDGLEDIKQCTADDRVGAVLCGLLVEG